jgi:hypothetical protein
MKNKLSLIVAALLVTSSSVFASSYQDSVAKKEAQAIHHSSSVKTKLAKAEVDASMSQEAYMAKVKAGVFKSEANQDETKRLHKVVSSLMKTHKQTLKQAPKEFMSGLSNTVNALQAIRQGDNKKAQKFLSEADKDLTTALKKEPKLNLVPVRDNATVISFNGGPELIKHIKKSAIKLLKANDTQAAIDILEPLQDELVIKTQYVPAYLFPAAVKKASKELKAGKDKLAFSVILSALEASQVDIIVMPIPLITAEDMILEASKLEKSHKKEALATLKMAKEELEKARLLGYTHKNEQGYKNLQKQIKAIQTEIKGKNVVVKMYDKLLKDFKTLKAQHTLNKK